jgi:hypothetical protein
VVTQRIANPCTGVRFSYSPPFTFKDLDACRRATGGESKHSSKHSVFVLFSFGALLETRNGLSRDRSQHTAASSDGGPEAMNVHRLIRSWMFSGRS